MTMLIDGRLWAKRVYADQVQSSYKPKWTQFHLAMASHWDGNDPAGPDSRVAIFLHIPGLDPHRTLAAKLHFQDLEAVLCPILAPVFPDPYGPDAFHPYNHPLYWAQGYEEHDGVADQLPGITIRLSTRQGAPLQALNAHQKLALRDRFAQAAHQQAALQAADAAAHPDEW